MKHCIEREVFQFQMFVFRWCVTLGNRVHGISTETDLTNFSNKEIVIAYFAENLVDHNVVAVAE
jgi:hypothetical protein